MKGWEVVADNLKKAEFIRSPVQLKFVDSLRELMPSLVYVFERLCKIL